MDLVVTGVYASHVYKPKAEDPGGSNKFKLVAVEIARASDFQHENKHINITHTSNFLATSMSLSAEQFSFSLAVRCSNQRAVTPIPACYMSSLVWQVSSLKEWVCATVARAATKSTRTTTVT